jgi:hypothetical protein
LHAQLANAQLAELAERRTTNPRSYNLQNNKNILLHTLKSQAFIAHLHPVGMHTETEIEME